MNHSSLIFQVKLEYRSIFLSNPPWIPCTVLYDKDYADKLISYYPNVFQPKESPN